MNFVDTLMTVKLTLDSGAVPLIVGETGIGKTALIKKLCSDLNYNFITIEGSLLKEGEIGGLPVVEDYSETINGKTVIRKRTVYAVHHKLKKIEDFLSEDKSKKVLLFIDEINRCEHAVQQELMNIILNREINGYILPDSTVIVAAMNPSNKYDNYLENQYQITEMDPAQENRFVWINMESNAENWIQWGTEQNERHIQNIHSDILQFISMFPQYLNRTDSNESTRATPRSWERVSKAYTAYENNKAAYTENILFNVIKGNIGSEIAQEFVNFTHERPEFIFDARDILVQNNISDRLLNALRHETHEKLFLFTINCLNLIEKEEENDELINRFAKLLQYYPSDLKLAIMKKIKTYNQKHIYDKFINNKDFVDAFFKIYI
ncbi:ATP-binding protein [Clostridium oryzae]|uniref:ATPase family n=1 Tax=Clostridium oryzae TaxID=1450648 RepID=A0A1V4IR74_9CLOT|nr:AAA family ATPase [Clostridium oryzae]OPJ62436.1 ATPase family [Clostridium oryzae]